MKLLKNFPWEMLAGFCVIAVLAWVFLPAFASDPFGGPDEAGSAGQVVTYTDPIGAKTASFQTSAYDLCSSTRLTAHLEATAVSGSSPTCDCVIESSTDGVNWFTTGTAYTTLTAKGSEIKSVQSDVFHRNVRLNCTIGGTTPSFTLNAYATGHVQ